MPLKIWGAIVAAAIAWGTTGVATRAALNHGVPPLALSEIRAVLSTVVLLGWLLLRGRRINRDPHNLVTGLTGAQDFPGHVLDMSHRRHRRAAKFLDQKRHNRL